MPGDIKAKERSIITLTTTGASLTNGSAGAAGTSLDLRAAGGTGNADGDTRFRLELVCQWATITGIVKGTRIAEVYGVPKLDGTNAPDVDTTAGSSAIPFECFLDLLSAIKAPTANTNMRFVSRIIDAFPSLYDLYVLNRSGQTMAANWSLKAVPAKDQYT